MPPAPRQSLPGTIVTFLLFGLACSLYLVLLASTYDAHTSDGAGRGLAAAYAALFGGVLWIVLAIMLALGAARGAMPGWAAVAAVVLLPLSGPWIWNGRCRISNGWPARDATLALP